MQTSYRVPHNHDCAFKSITDLSGNLSASRLLCGPFYSEDETTDDALGNTLRLLFGPANVNREQIVEYGEYIMMPAAERTKIDVRTQRRSYTHSPSPSCDRLMLGKNVRFRSYFNVREVV